MIFKGTDIEAFKKASRGLTKKSRSKKYQKYKDKNAKNRGNETALLSFFQSKFSLKMPKSAARIKPKVISIQNSRTNRYMEKKIILDDIRDFRSSKIVSNLSNNLAAFIVKCGGQQWNDNTRNFVRSSIALAISEVTNKILEKPQEIINNIKLFIKVGKIIYKIIVWIDKDTSLWVTSEQSISVVNESDIEYVEYIYKYPRLVESLHRQDKMKYKIRDIVLLNDGKIVRIVAINVCDKTYKAISVDKEQKKYIIRDKDIKSLF